MSLPLLPSFILAGFECSTPINSAGRRIDELAMTQHDARVREDYRRLREIGIHTVRDGVRWNLVDRRGRLDFSSVLPFIEAAKHEHITVIWDLFHYGYPDDLNPFSAEFIDRFAAYCHGFAILIGSQFWETPFYTPVNEISYFAWAAGGHGLFAPHLVDCGPELKRQLARASIAGMNAMLAVDPRARFVHCEPLVHVAAPLDAPWLADEANYFNDRCVHEAWDMIGGFLEPDLGGSPRHLDIIGVNYYGYNQWEHQRPGSVLSLDDPRRLPFHELLKQMQRRYDRPIVVAETASHAEFRPDWVRDMGHECLIALEQGVDLRGLCIYPIIDMFDWHEDASVPKQMGLWDLRRNDGEDGRLERVLHEPTYQEVRRLQEALSGRPDQTPARVVPISRRARVEAA